MHILGSSRADCKGGPHFSTARSERAAQRYSKMPSGIFEYPNRDEGAKQLLEMQVSEDF